ncbi:MAG: hypothetical protein AB1631_26675 [Acidobacteriota bacterium]
MRTKFPTAIAWWRRFRVWQERNREFLDAGDIDPDGQMLARCRKLITDLLKLLAYFFGGMAALSGVALANLFSGPRSHAQLRIAEYVFLIASEAVVSIGYLFLLIYFLHFIDFANVFSPKPNRFSFKARAFKFLNLAILGFFVGSVVVYILLDPAHNLRELRLKVPGFVRAQRCEMEAAEALKSDKFVPTMDCSALRTSEPEPVPKAPVPAN